MTGGVRLYPAAEDGLGYVEERLSANGLPTDDVRSKPDCFYVARAAGGEGDRTGGAAPGAADGGDDGAGDRGSGTGSRVGVGGLEVHGGDALLRSVVVEAPERGAGYGTAICDRLEARAREDGVGTLWLFTTTAAGFFADRGYETVERSAAPPAIRSTSEFADLCPASATCMRRLP